MPPPAGLNVARIDLAMMGLVMAVTVIGLKIVGLILIVALLIIPPVAARFWTEARPRGLDRGRSWAGCRAMSARRCRPRRRTLPTGPIIVLVAFADIRAVAAACAGARVLAAAMCGTGGSSARVHRRQGLLALAQGQPIYEPLTLRLLRREGWRAPMAWPPRRAARRRPSAARMNGAGTSPARGRMRTRPTGRYDGLTPIETRC
jgi:manganese/zinc/iron transport system permease protein